MPLFLPKLYGKVCRKKSLAYAKHTHFHGHTHTHTHGHTVDGPETAKRLTAALEVQVSNARSSPENIPKFSP